MNHLVEKIMIIVRRRRRRGRRKRSGRDKKIAGVEVGIRGIALRQRTY